jgi:hypothetical protein
MYCRPEFELHTEECIKGSGCTDWMKCPVCQKRVKMKRDGRPYAHQVFGYPCHGSRLLLTDEQQKQRDKLRDEAHAENPYLCDPECDTAAQEGD